MKKRSENKTTNRIWKTWDNCIFFKRKIADVSPIFNSHKPLFIGPRVSDAALVTELNSYYASFRTYIYMQCTASVRSEKFPIYANRNRIFQCHIIYHHSPTSEHYSATSRTYLLGGQWRWYHRKKNHHSRLSVYSQYSICKQNFKHTDLSMPHFGAVEFNFMFICGFKFGTI